MNGAAQPQPASCRARGGALSIPDPRGRRPLRGAAFLARDRRRRSATTAARGLKGASSVADQRRGSASALPPLTPRARGGAERRDRDQQVFWSGNDIPEPCWRHPRALRHRSLRPGVIWSPATKSAALRLSASSTVKSPAPSPRSPCGPRWRCSRAYTRERTRFGRAVDVPLSDRRMMGRAVTLPRRRWEKALRGDLLAKHSRRDPAAPQVSFASRGIG